MKNIFWVFSFFGFFSCFAQNFWSVADSKKSQVADLAFLGDTIVVMSGTTDKGFCWNHKIMAYNLVGKFLWQNNAEADVVYSQSGILYAFGTNIGADDVIGDEYLAFNKIDKNGNVIYTSKYPKVQSVNQYFDFVPKSIAVSESKNIFISSQNSIIKMDTLGNVSFEKKLKTQSDIKIIKCNKKRVFIHASKRLYKADSLGNLLDSVVLSNNSQTISIKNDSIFELTNSKFKILDTNLVYLDSVDLQSGVSFEKMLIYNNSNYVLGKDFNNLYILTINGSTVANTKIFPSLTDFPKFLVKNNSYFFSGNTIFKQMGMFKYDNSTNTVFVPNFIISEFYIKNTAIRYEDVSGKQQPYGYDFDAVISIKNIGTDTIKSFSGFLNLSGGVNCAQNYFYKHFDNLQLLNNQTYITTILGIYEPGFNANLCFEVFAPNGKIETDNSSNTLCKNPNITLIENRIVDLTFDIFPNPFTENLTIDLLNNSTKQITIFGVTGKILFLKTTSQIAENIDLTILHKGIYILKISSNEFMKTYKIIKQ